ncbi:BEN domain-containing protein 7 isoform X2 [Acanthochromis polyacanthus]|uniref:BEN domain-containing protein 7 isoform X2 n=1 Tax=Acanthochromis polyacanthus TaxID=80966 RepID=UPI002234D911|nr:BEN domain-containing protein 7 isoform X2 [Acanthochromis polyacanthus]
MGWEGVLLWLTSQPISLHKLQHDNAEGCNIVLQHLSHTHTHTEVLLSFFTAALHFRTPVPLADFDPSYMMNSSCKDANGVPKDAAAVSDVWLEDEGMEIKKQITGMMRLLSDKTGRVYQRVGAEQDGSTKEPQDRHLNWAHQPGLLSVVSEDHQSNSWNSAAEPGPSPPSASTSIPNGPGCGQYSTRSRALRILNNTKDLIKVNEANDVVPPAVPETPCCMCNCKGTLQAILQELRAMRRLMQTQKASLERQEQTASPCQPRLGPGPTPRRRPRKRRPIYKVAPVAVTSARRAALSPLKASPLQAAPAESGKREECEKDSSTPNIHPISSDVSVLPPQTDPVTVNNTHSPLLNQLKEPQAVESEVRLAEDYDVFISKAQLDSILVNYTRSGSLLFRKLVCAFFDDATLANSLPNGKRKRGLNDNRQGLDQNIVGAIKVFTEKYCTEHRIEKLPGPRDWVQILQDQIKLARRRVKRDAAEAEEVSNGPSTSCDLNKPASVEWTVVNITG